MNETIDWEPGDALIFAQVVDSGSFTSAAKSLRMPKSSVSRRVSRLENSLGLQLLKRTTRQLNLTEAGQAFYVEAARAGDALLAAERAATTILDQPRGRLRVTAPPEMGGQNLEVLLAFGKQYPDLTIDLNLSSQFVDLVEQGFDVALRGGKPPQGSLTGRLIEEGSAIIVGSPEYLAKNGTPKRATDIANHESILFPNQVKGGAWRMEGPRGVRKVPVKGRLSINTLEGVRHAALAGWGLALLPSGHCEADVQRGDLVRVLPRMNQATGGFWVVYPRTPFLPTKVRCFVDFVYAAYANLRAGRPILPD